MTYAVKDRLHDHGYAPSFRNGHRPLSRSGFVVGGYSSYLEDYVEEGNFICDNLKLRYHVQRVSYGDKFQQSW